MTIKTKLIITFLTIAAIPMLLIGALGFINAKDSLEASALENLNSIAEGKEAQILEFLSSKKERTKDFASDGFIQDNLEAFQKSGNEVEKSKIAEILTKHLNTNKKPLDKDILDVHVLDVRGIIIAVTNKDEIGDDESAESYFEKSLRGAYIDDAHLHEGHREDIFIAVGAPIKSRVSNKVIGVLMNSYSVKNIEDFVSGERAKNLGAPTTIENTGTRDIFIVNQDGLMITPSKKMTGFENLDHDMTMHIAVQACLSAQELNGEWKDSSGVSVLGASMCPQAEKDWRWTIVVEQEMDEVLAPVNGLRDVSLIIGFIILLLTVFTAFFIAKSMSDPIRKLTEIVDGVSKGKLDTKIEEVNTKDEIGDLARAFGRTIVSLKLAMRKQGGAQNNNNFGVQDEKGTTLEDSVNRIT